jgi:serine/threonine-protein kinase
VPLKSAVGYDYTKLRDLLAKQKWQEADEETAKAMLTVAGRDDLLREEDIDNFPCEDLRTIDRLWLKFSNGKFGFSVQKEIYQQLGGTREFDLDIWIKFGDTVGWRVNGCWKNYGELNWRRPLRDNTPVGHLPYGARVWAIPGKRLERFSLLSRRDL